MDWNEVEKRLKMAFQIFGLQDKDLFIAPPAKPLERPAATRLAMYLQVLFPDYYVDCEYGRYESNPKNLDMLTLSDSAKTALRDEGLTDAFDNWKKKERTKLEQAEEKQKEQKKQKEVKLIVPDIVIHRRGQQENNLLYLEAKPLSEWDDEDSVKLSLVTSGVKVGDKDLKYDYGLQVNLQLHRTMNQAEARLWVGGRTTKADLRFPF